MCGREHGAATASAVVSALVIAFLAMGGGARAQTLEQAITAAYVNNPTLNAQRAAVRATDENVPKALSGYRPTITGSASAARANLSTITQAQTIGPLSIPASNSNSTLWQNTLSLNLNQNLYNG